ncbi:MAG: hypothetical protein ACO27N_06970, partial [Bacteroidia bacterium]
MSFWIVLNYILGDAFGPGYPGSLCSVAFGEKTLRIPIAYFIKFYVLKSASMVLALKNMLHPKI